MPGHKVRAEVRWRRWRRLAGLLCLLVGASRCGQGMGVKGAGVTPLSQPPEDNGGFAVAALRSFLRTSQTSIPMCSVAILADHTPTANAIVRGLPTRYAEGGAALLRLPAHDDVDRTSADALKDLVKAGRRLRLISDCFTVVFVTDSIHTLKAMLKQSTDGRLMVWVTHGLIVTSLPRSIVLPTIEGIWAFTMMNSHLLLLPSPGHSGLVFRYEPYSPTGPRLVTIGHFTPQGELIISSPIHYEKFDNFFGAEINFTASISSGVVKTMQPNGTKTFKFTGKGYPMLLSFGKTRNFKPVFLDSDTYEGVIDHVVERSSLVIAGPFYVSARRLKQVDYIAPFATDDLAFVMRKPGVISGWDSFMRPFFKEVWLFILAIILLLPACLVLVLKFSSGDHVVVSKLRGGQQTTGAVQELSKIRALFEVFGALLGQDFSFKMPHTNSFRMLLAAWFVFIIVLSTGYKSNLIVFMTSPTIAPRHETLKELIDANVTVTIKSKAHLKRLQTSDNIDYQTIGARCQVVASNIVGVDMALKQGSAHFEDRERLTYVVAETFTHLDGSTDIYPGRERILSSIVAPPIPHDAPYKPQFDLLNLYFIQGGLMDKLEQLKSERIRAAALVKAKENKDSFEPSNDGSLKALNLDNLQGPFWLLMAGNTLGILCFLGEKIVARCTKKKGRAPLQAAAHA